MKGPVGAANELLAEINTRRDLDETLRARAAKLLALMRDDLAFGRAPTHAGRLARLVIDEWPDPGDHLGGRLVEFDLKARGR